MKIITINVPDQYLDDFEVLVKLGLYPSRSEAVRECLKQFLMNESILNHNIAKDNFLQMKKAQIGGLIH